MRNLAFILFFVSGFICAQTTTPAFFGNNMVLQQNNTVAIWGEDKPESTVKLETSWGVDKSTITNLDGTWRIEFETQAGSFLKQDLKIKGTSFLHYTNILVGEVWFCSGQSNMEMPMKGVNNSPINNSNQFLLDSKNPNIRLFDTERKGTLKPDTDVIGIWEEANAVSVKEFSAIGYIFAKNIQEKIKVPIGIISSAWGGTKIEAWMPQEILLEYDDIKISKVLEDKPYKRRTPSQIFNGMIHPFKDFKIKGFLWYQGESNRDQEKPELYKNYMNTLVKSWRNQWADTTLPFYFVQIAPYAYEKRSKSSKFKVALIREAQLKASEEIPNSGLVVTSDVGNCTDIHPAEKETIANRLSYWALAKQYGYTGIWFKSPVYKSMEVEKNKIIISFDFGLDINSGLSSYGKEINGFTIAASDGVFYPAKVIIDAKQTLTVYSENVQEPVAVRYGFQDCIKGSLYSLGKLPISPFRTDNWLE
ncbi:sialate O-acetylesterase [Polaribacter glomeratus]|uniref:Sialate O-acetylesterase domain-containing protein n=1 Tax=Polaribacter glomeratus TaxID=102 RepID=A0A2S7WHP4_9FLAO|nr:sialate O-acetylesterase [Polaribacter glomeratus]PQJ77125.1 hypothetical protein BTO16_14865 [Polaribacter glomeratus]TXD67024.1 sialate O-acetylesterase [Polaribacter glomeratus]